MGSMGTFLAVLLFGIIGLCIGAMVDAAEAGGIIFAIAIAAACIVAAIEKVSGPKAPKA